MSLHHRSVSRTPKAVVALLVIAFGASILAGGVASADTPGTTLDVTPSSGLIDGQSVGLSGIGYSVGASGTVSECGTNANGVGCVTIGSLSTTDPGGEIPAGTTVNVQSSFTATSGPANGTTVDCSTDNCFIDVSAFTTNATEPISFAAVPPVPAVLTITPDTNLPASQSVTASGTGFSPSSTVNFAQCKTSGGVNQSCLPNGSVLTDANGEFSTSLTVEETFNATQGVQGPVSCLPEDTCVVDAADAVKQDSAAISFAPPVPPTPAITVNPDTDLPSPAMVDVSGTGFAPGATTNFFQCKTVSGTVVACAPVGSGTMTDGAGAFGPVAVPVTVTFTPTQGDLTPVDCLVDTCVVDASAAGADANAPITFAAPQPPANPVLTVTPDTNLPPTQEVTAAGTGFTPQATVNFSQCKLNGMTIESCVPIGSGFTDSNGAFSSQVTVTETFTATQGAVQGPVSCLPENTCIVDATDVGAGQPQDSAPITFAPIVVPPPNPVLTVEPNSDLAASHEVVVTGTNFSDSASVNIFECKPNTPVQSCVQIGTAFTDSEGNFSQPVTVTRTFTATSGTVGAVDCLPENDCQVAASDAGGAEGVANISFATEVIPPPDPEPESRICALLRQARTNFNATIDRIESFIPQLFWGGLEILRSIYNAGNDAALALNNCEPVIPFSQPAAAPVNTSAAPATTPAAVVSAPVTSTPGAPASTYTVRVGDTLSRIAQRLLGSASAFPRLAEMNGVSNPSLIFPGQVLQLPG